MEPRIKLVGVGEAPAEQEASDDLLMADAAAGRRSAFDTLIARHQTSVLRFARVITGDPAVAEDIAQEVFIKLWLVRQGYRPEGRLRALIFTITRNLCRSANRRRAIRNWFSSAEKSQALPPHDGPADALLRAETIDRVGARLLQLPEKFRLPLLLRFGEEMPYEEIALVIGRTPSAARSRVHYGLKALSELLPEDLR